MTSQEQVVLTVLHDLLSPSEQTLGQYLK